MRKLRIFIATDSSPNAKGLVNSAIWDRNLVDPLVDLGHEVIRFDYDLHPFSVHASTVAEKDVAWQKIHRPQLEEALLAQVRRHQSQKGLDVFLSYFWDAHAGPEVIREIKSLGIATVNWFCNGSFQIHMVRQIAPAYDWSLVPEKFRLPDYRALHANPIYFQEAANPLFYKPAPVAQDLGITFVGQCYGDRVNYIGALHRAGLPVDVFGPRWIEQAQKDDSIRGRFRRWTPVRTIRESVRRMRGKAIARRDPVPLSVAHAPVSDDELVSIHNRSKISLGFSSCGDTDRGGNKIVQVRLRDMEVPMCGGFYLVERFEELAEFFEYGTEIEGYQSDAELVDKCRFYLAHDAERKRIQEAGRRRALAEHTWQKRFQDLFHTMGFAG